MERLSPRAPTAGNPAPQSPKLETSRSSLPLNPESSSVTREPADRPLPLPGPPLVPPPHAAPAAPGQPLGPPPAAIPRRPRDHPEPAVRSPLAPATPRDHPDPCPPPAAPRRPPPPPATPGTTPTPARPPPPPAAPRHPRDHPEAGGRPPSPPGPPRARRRTAAAFRTGAHRPAPPAAPRAGRARICNDVGVSFQLWDPTGRRDWGRGWGGTRGRDGDAGSGTARPGVRRREGSKRAAAGFSAAISGLGLERAGKPGGTRGGSDGAERASGCCRGCDLARRGHLGGGSRGGD
ncbi:hypothetical protein P7K49_015199 [Saguinus oedipus]|uniref:Basic proline-rich protein-like n=1 Tax=Saguinus oedipus TaxID=9490 RepID=A0ABQ9V926_SAGOE|nr:hypothetical protein P7K49_015199 [Saguinus oedipus]